MKTEAEIKNEIQKLLTTVKTLREELVRIKNEERRDRKSSKHEAEMAKIRSLGFDEEWMRIAETGFTYNEIIALQWFGGGWTLKAIGAELGVSGDRVASIRDKAARKLRHPSRAFEMPKSFYKPSTN